MQLDHNAISERVKSALGGLGVPRPLTPAAKLHLAQRAARVAAELPEDREAALFLLDRAAAIHSLIAQEAVKQDSKAD